MSSRHLSHTVFCEDVQWRSLQFGILVHSKMVDIYWRIFLTRNTSQQSYTLCIVVDRIKAALKKNLLTFKITCFNVYTTCWVEFSSQLRTKGTEICCCLSVFSKMFGTMPRGCITQSGDIKNAIEGKWYKTRQFFYLRWNITRKLRENNIFHLGSYLVKIRPDNGITRYVTSDTWA